MKIRKNIYKNTLSMILKAIMSKKGIDEIQLTYNDIAKCKDEKIKIERWKSGIFAEEIIDIQYIKDEVII